VAEIITPERARARLIAFLDANCVAEFRPDNFTDAVLSAHRLGEEEISRLTFGLICNLADFKRSEVPDLVWDRSGRRYSIRVGIDPVIPSSLAVRISTYPDSTASTETMRVRELTSSGRYKLITGLAPPDKIYVLEAAINAVEKMLEALQEWIEDRLYVTLEQLTDTLTDGIYQLLKELGDSIEQGRVDIATIGKRRGQRIPNPHILHRSLEALRGSSASGDADLLAATFVGSSLPRDELLMSRALDVHHAIVVPFSEARYVISGSYFGIACQLLDGSETNVIDPIYESPDLSVVLIYRHEDQAIRAAVDHHMEELREFVRSHLRVFEKALRFVEEPRPSYPRDKLLVPGYNLLTVLDQVTADEPDRGDGSEGPKDKRPGWLRRSN
jgi:hypothetical protein